MSSLSEGATRVVLTGLVDFDLRRVGAEGVLDVGRGRQRARESPIPAQTNDDGSVFAARSRQLRFRRSRDRHERAGQGALIGRLVPRTYSSYQAR